MNSGPYNLLIEDRQDYERILDEALRATPHRPELAAMGQRLSPEQLRTMAQNATALIMAAAATEYQHYVRVRDQLRRQGSPDESAGIKSSPSAGAPSSSALPRSGTRPKANGHAPTGPGRRFAAALLGAGPPGGRRISSGIAPPRWARMSYGRRLLAGLIGLHVRPVAATTTAEEELARAREAWREAVLERGIMPFLRETLAGPTTASPHSNTSLEPSSQLPLLGYDRSGVGARHSPAPAPRPPFTSPDFTGPETEAVTAQTQTENLTTETLAPRAVRHYSVAPGSRLNVRSGPGTQYSIVRLLPEGARVPINCQLPGETTSGPYGTTNLWDNIADGEYVADVYVNTGSVGYIAPRCS